MSLTPFCKLFDIQDYGQILIKIDESESRDPEIRVYAQPNGLGVCSLAVTFDDWETADAFFTGLDEEKAIRFAKTIFDSARGTEVE